MVWVERERFEVMVGEALDGLPPQLGRMMRNVAVTVDHDSPPNGLLGLYQGVPLTERTSQYAGVLPDHITIYRQAICSCATATSRWSTKCAAPSCTRSDTTSASTTTGCTNSAGERAAARPPDVDR